MSRISFQYLSQEDLIKAGCFDLDLVIAATEKSLIEFENGNILFPDKIVQIFNDSNQERINCLAATILNEKVCGVKWISVFPHNPVKYNKQNICAIIVLSNTINGFPIAVMDGTLCSNLRVGAIAAIAAKHLAAKNSATVGFIGAGEQAKSIFIALKKVLPDLKKCNVCAKSALEEDHFAQEMKQIFPEVIFHNCQTEYEKAVYDADIIVTATSANVPFLKADWIVKSTLYIHIGGWEDEFEVVKSFDKIICDDWETVKHRTQTLSRMYETKLIQDSDIYCNLTDLVNGKKPGRLNETEKIYFNAVGLSYVDIYIALSMYRKANRNNVGKMLNLQESMMFEKITSKLTL